MERVKQLKTLGALARIKADVLRAKLARARQAERETEQALKALEMHPEFTPASREEGASIQASARWRQQRRVTLRAQLALQRAQSQPLKEEASRAMAREAVIKRLSEQEAP